MLYSEFVAGTGCKENSHNYKVYRDLEVMYMNSDISKEEIYEYGKKLVDNRKSKAELDAEAEVKAAIDQYKEDINYHKDNIVRYKLFADISADKTEERMWKDYIKEERKIIKNHRARIAELKWILS